MKKIEIIIGIDLAGKERNQTGICIMNEELLIETVYSNEDIKRKVYSFNPEKTLIAIDSPLIEDGIPRTRLADRLLKKYGALSPNMKSMRELVRRASTLKRDFERRGYEVIEVFPTATSKILGIYDKNYRRVAERLGIRIKNKHELDAYLCALTGKLFLEGKTQAIGDKDGRIVVPNHRITFL